jgi:hypothetical protein
MLRMQSRPSFLIDMSISYNRIAGQRVERLAALSDGIFGVAMTLLLLDLPVRGDIHTEAELRTELLGLLPHLAIYHAAFDEVHLAPRGASVLLGQHSSAGRDALRLLGLGNASGAGE